MGLLSIPGVLSFCIDSAGEDGGLQQRFNGKKKSKKKESKKKGSKKKGSKKKENGSRVDNGRGDGREIVRKTEPKC